MTGENYCTNLYNIIYYLVVCWLCMYQYICIIAGVLLAAIFYNFVDMPKLRKGIKAEFKLIPNICSSCNLFAQLQNALFGGLFL